VKTARATIALIALAFAALVGVCAWLQHDFEPRSAEVSHAVAPQANAERGDVATLADGAHDAPGSASNERAEPPAPHALESSPPEAAPGTVSGRVTELDAKAGIARARVRLTVERADGMHEVAELVTGDDGRYEIVIAEIAAWSDAERDTARVLADASADGHIPAQNWSYVSAPGNRVHDLDLALGGGDQVRGRVVDASGRPVAFADVTAMRFADLDDGAAELEIAGPRNARSDALGRFVLGVRVDERACRLIVTATAEGVGCARAVVQQPADAASFEIGDVVLQEFGVLAGRLAGSDGRALPGVDLEFRGVRAPDAASSRLEDLEFNAPITFLRHGAVLTQLPLGADGKPLPEFAGRTSARAHTDQLGNFRVTGLCVGSYGVRIVFGGAGDAGGKGALADPDGKTAFETGSRAIALVAKGAWIHARVVDAAGAIVPGADLECAELSALASNALDVAKWTTVELDHGEMSRRFDSGARVVLRAKVGDDSTGERVIDAPHDGVLDVVLALAPRPELARGRMRAKVTLPDGGECHDYVITLRSPATHLPCAHYSAFEEDDDGWSPPLPGGTFDVQVRVHEPEGYREPHLLPISGGPVTIGPGLAPDLAIEAQLGGRLDLTVSASRDANHESGWLAGSKATLSDRAERALELDLRYDWFGSDVSAGAPPLDRYSAVSRLLTPGVYRLHIECSGFECIDVPVTLVGGETNYSEFELVAQPKK
jgi:hypothetical protein